MIKNINIKLEDTLLAKFEKKIEENNHELANKLNKSSVIRDLINNYITRN